MTNHLENIFLAALEQNQNKLLRICSVYSKNDEDKKDLFQEVLIHIWQSLPSFNANSSISTWMYRITLNVCLRFRTKHTKNINRFIHLESLSIEAFKENPESTDQNDKLTYLRNCIRELNEADKAVISLYLEELPYKEISIITGLTENTIAVKVKRIKGKLLNCIKVRS